MIKLSVVLATRNEEKNIKRCLDSVREFADEIIVVDEYSTDKTRDVSRSLGAKVFKEKHHSIFHVTKQKALSLARGEWVLQLDADEVVTKKLANEILETINKSNEELVIKRREVLNENKLFSRHQKEIEKRDGKIGAKTGEIVAFFIPRLNIFLGKPLKHAGVYPDPAIRLIKNGRASFPSKSVHEIMSITGEVSWLSNYMEHYDSPTFSRYLERANRYTDLTAREFNDRKTLKSIKNLIYYTFIKSTFILVNLFFIHGGYKDGMSGFIWSLFSAIHFPIAYYKYWTDRN